MSNRWKVVRREVPFPEPHWRWEVLENLGTVEGFHGPFTTHAEAIAYADRMARTITVTLPRATETIREINDNVYLNSRAPSSNYGVDILITDIQKTVGISLTRRELEPVALYLLALSRKDAQ